MGDIPRYVALAARTSSLLSHARMLQTRACCISVLTSLVSRSIPSCGTFGETAITGCGKRLDGRMKEKTVSHNFRTRNSCGRVFIIIAYGKRCKATFCCRIFLSSIRTVLCGPVLDDRKGTRVELRERYQRDNLKKRPYDVSAQIKNSII